MLSQPFFLVNINKGIVSLFSNVQSQITQLLVRIMMMIITLPELVTILHILVRSYLQIFSRSLKSVSSANKFTHNWPLQLFSQDYGLASHNTHVVGFNFIRKQRDIQFNIDSETQISFLGNFFRGRFIYTRSFCQKSAERKMPDLLYEHGLYV